MEAVNNYCMQRGKGPFDFYYYVGRLITFHPEATTMLMDELKNLTVKELRTQLEALGLDKSGNKAALVQRLQEAALKKAEIAPEDAEVVPESDNHLNEDETEAEVDVTDPDVSVETKAASPVIQVEEESEESDATVKIESEDKGGASDMAKNQDVDKEVIETPEKSDDVETNVDDIKQIEESTEPSEIPEERNEENQAAEDDHDELHISVGDDELDKFEIDGEEDTYPEDTAIKTDEQITTSTDKRGSILTQENVSQEQGPLDDNLGSSSVEKADTNENVPNQVSSSSKEEKTVEKVPQDVQEKPAEEPRSNTLMVTGLSAKTAATDLKAVFKKHGKIGGVKIMTNSKDPDTRFALVAVGSAEDMNICINQLDATELHGRIINVKKAGTDMLTAEWQRKESHRDSSSAKRTDGKKVEIEKKDGKAKGDGKKGADPSATKAKSTKKTSSDKSNPKEPSDLKPESRRIPSTTNGADKAPHPSAEKTTEKPKSDADTRSPGAARPPKRVITTRRNNDVRPILRKESKDPDRRGRREEFVRHHPGRVERNPREVARHHQEVQDLRDRNFIRHRQAMQEERGRDAHRRFHSSHGRDRSPEGRSHSFRRASPEHRRTGRQELTFEDIYDIREKEKRRGLDRERREIERRRQEDEERQRLLDQEIRMLAKQRERIEQEKQELKKQKERMIMLEREKQREERERLQREKEELQRRLEEGRRASKRAHAEDPYEILERKKPTFDERAASTRSYADSHSRTEKEKVRTDTYRRSESSRYKPVDNLDRRSLTPVRGAPMRNAPVRDSRTANWEERERGVRERTPERLSHRERDPVKVIRTDDRREERKPFPAIIQEVAARYDWSSRPAETKTETYSNNSSRDDRYPVRSVPIYSADPHASQLQVVRNDTWQTGRDNTWTSTERTTSRPVTEMPDRWVSGTSAPSHTGRLTMPVAPPPPIFSAPTASTVVHLNSAQQFSGAGGRYSYDSYKQLQALSRR